MDVVLIPRDGVKSKTKMAALGSVSLLVSWRKDGRVPNFRSIQFEYAPLRFCVGLVCRRSYRQFFVKTRLVTVSERPSSTRCRATIRPRYIGSSHTS